MNLKELLQTVGIGRSPEDDSPEKGLAPFDVGRPGGCGFTQEEIDSAPPVELEEPGDED